MSKIYPLLALKDAGVELIDCVHATPKETGNPGYPYVGIPQLKDGRLDLSDARVISHEDMEVWNKRCNIRSGDIIVCRRCNSGISAVVPDNFTGSLGQNLVLLRSDEKTLYQDYLRWAVRGEEWWGEVHKYINVGAVFDSLKCKEIPTFKIPVPNRDNQKAIAHVLGTLDDKIELNQKMNQTLEEIAKAIFKSWFVDFDPVRAKAEGRTTDLPPEISDLFPDELVDSEIGEIPKGWSVSTLGDLVTPKKGKSITKKKVVEGSVPVVAGGLSPAYYHNTSNVKAPTVTISASGANAGFARLYNEDIWASDCSYISEEQTPFVFLWYVFLKIHQEKIYHMQQGAAQPHIYPSDLMRLQLAYPESDELWRLALDSITPMFLRIGNAEKESVVLSELRDTLLPKLISGELRIPDAEKFLEEAGI